MAIIEVGGPLGGIADHVFTRMRPVAIALLATVGARPAAAPSSAPTPTPTATTPTSRPTVCDCEVVIVDRALTRC